jgi:hypothetical protein
MMMKKERPLKSKMLPITATIIRSTNREEE